MENKFTLFVKGLHPQTEEESLRRYFEGHGMIESILLKKDKAKNISRGFAFVSFESMEVCDRILRTTHKIDGKKVAITYAMTPTEALKTKSRKVAGAGSLIISKIPLSVDRQSLLACLEQKGEVAFLSDFLRSIHGPKYVFVTFADPSVGAKLVDERRLRLQNFTLQVYSQTEHGPSGQMYQEQGLPDEFQENIPDMPEEKTWQQDEHGYEGMSNLPYPSPEEQITYQEDHWPVQAPQYPCNVQNSYFVPPTPVRRARMDGRWMPLTPYHQNWPKYGYNQTLESQNMNVLPKYGEEIGFPSPYSNFGDETYNEWANVYPRQAIHSAQYRSPDHEGQQISSQLHANSISDTGHTDAGNSSGKTEETRDEPRVEWLKKEITRLEYSLTNLKHLLHQEENKPKVYEQ